MRILPVSWSLCLLAVEMVLAGPRRRARSEER